MRRLWLLAIVVLWLLAVNAEEALSPSIEGSADSSSVVTPFVTAYTITKSRAGELHAVHRLWDGHTMNIVRGDIAEDRVERAFFGEAGLSHTKKGAYVSVSPRFGRQGIDHVWMRVNHEGLPNGSIILGETKYGSSTLGMTRDGGQMTTPWRLSRVRGIGGRYLLFADSTDQIIRSKAMPIGCRHHMDVYFSETRKVTIWKSDGSYYTDAGDTLTDGQLRMRARTYGEYFQSAGAGRIRSRNFLFRISQQDNGDYLLRIGKLSDDTVVNSERLVVLPREHTAKGYVSEKVLCEKLKPKFPRLSDVELREMARDMRRVISNDELMRAGEMKEIAGKEILRSSLSGASIAGGIMFAFEAWNHGTDFSAYDKEKLLEVPIVTGVASYLGQKAACCLVGRGWSLKWAGRVGGVGGAGVAFMPILWECSRGNKCWRYGSIEIGIETASMAAGHYAAVGAELLLTSWGAGTAGGAAGTAVATGTMAAGSATTASATMGATAGMAAMCAAATVVAVAAVGYAGYKVYDYYKGIDRVTGDITVYERKLERFMQDSNLYDKTLNETLGL